MTIKILGAKGCKKCSKLKERVEKIIEELEKEEIEVEKVNDPTKAVEYGVMSTPALVIDEKVIFSGKLPSEKEIRNIFK